MENLEEIPRVSRTVKIIGYNNLMSNLDVSQSSLKPLANVRIRCREALKRESAEGWRQSDKKY